MVVKLIPQTFNLDFLSLVYFSPLLLTIGALGHDNWPLKLIVYFVFFIGKTCLEIKSLRDKARALTIAGITNMCNLHLYFFLSFTCCLLKIVNVKKTVNVKNIASIPKFIMFEKCHFFKKYSSLLMYAMSFIFILYHVHLYTY